MTISKSNYVKFLTCPRLCWFSFFAKDEAKPSDKECKQIKDGKIVGDYAKQYFKDVLDVTKANPDGSLDLSAMIAATKQALGDNVPVIAEASFSTDDLFCSVDILVKSGDAYDIYEVKAAKNIAGKHYQDAAFQTYVLKKCGLNVRHTYLLILNKDYVRHGNLDLQQLFLPVLLDDAAEFLSAYGQIDDALVSLRKLLELKDAPEGFLKQHSKCKQCAFSSYCYRKLPNPNVFSINRLQKRAELYEEGIVTFEDVVKSGTELNKRQKAQVDAYLNKKDVICDKAGLKAFLAAITYPIYHLDFESIEPVVPVCDGTKPLMQIPTQYSLHIEYEDGRVEHRQFLGDSVDPRRKVAESLVADIPSDVTVLAYNKTFECNRLEELADLFSDLRDHLLSIRSHVIDLIVPFKQGDYYASAMGGSNSIKEVLPALTGNDPELDYHALPFVHRGSEAMDAYLPMLDESEPRRTWMRDGLLEYCKLDTLAMVKVLAVLRKAAK